MTQRDVCPTCGYNLPSHGFDCTNAEQQDKLCPEHATGRKRGRGSADVRLTCDVCGASGHHVRYYRGV